MKEVVKPKYKVGQRVEFVFVTPPHKIGIIEERYRNINNEPAWWIRLEEGQVRNGKFMKYNVPESSIIKKIE